MYSFFTSGTFDVAKLADWGYVKAVAASVEDNIYIAQALLGQIKDLGYMFGWRDAYNVGGAIQTYSPMAQAAGWNTWTQGAEGLYGLFASKGMPTQWAEGGIVNTPTWGVFGEAGPEAFLRLSDNSYVPTQFSNSGPAQQGSDKPIEINLSLEIDGEPLDAKIKVLARNESENVRVNLVRWGKQNSPRRQPT